MKTECIPEIIGAERDYAGRDYYGEPEYEVSFEYNCHSCENEDCEHWTDYHIEKRKG